METPERTGSTSVETTRSKTRMDSVYLPLAIVYLVLGLGVLVSTGSFIGAVVWFALAGTFFALSSTTSDDKDDDPDSADDDDEDSIDKDSDIKI